MYRRGTTSCVTGTAQMSSWRNTERPQRLCSGGNPTHCCIRNVCGCVSMQPFRLQSHASLLPMRARLGRARPSSRAQRPTWATPSAVWHSGCWVLSCWPPGRCCSRGSPRGCGPVPCEGGGGRVRLVWVSRRLRRHAACACASGEPVSGLACHRPAARKRHGVGLRHLSIGRPTVRLGPAAQPCVGDDSRILSADITGPLALSTPEVRIAMDGKQSS